MSWETYDPRVQCPGGQFKGGGGSCDTMTALSINRNSSSMMQQSLCHLSKREQDFRQATICPEATFQLLTHLKE